MTLLEVMVGFVIFTSSLVGILEYVSNQVYLSHITEKNQLKADIVYDYSIISALGDEAVAAFVTSQQGFGVSVASTALESHKTRRRNDVLVQTQVSVTDLNNDYQWSIFEIKK
jgi:hypothetical protein